MATIAHGCVGVTYHHASIILQILTFMPTGMTLNEEEVLAVCLKEESICSILRHSPKAIQKGITNLSGGSQAKQNPFRIPGRVGVLSRYCETQAAVDVGCVYT